MSSQKKLTLGPLPEQREDYSAYEESAIRWDRIVIAGLFVLILMFILFNLMTGSKDSTDEAQPSLVDSPERIETEAEAEVSKVPVPALGKTVEPEVRQDKAPVQPLVKKIEPLAKDTENKKVEVSIDTPAKSLDKDSGAASMKDAEIPHSPASVLITNSAIKEAALNLSSDNGLLGEAIKHSVVMPDKGLIKVVLSTQMVGLKGITLYHDWYRNGKREARVKIPVNVGKQNSYSSKFIDKYMLGAWQVKVVDSAGEPYILADFEVVGGN